MAKEIIWLPEAKDAFEQVILYLEKYWTEKEIGNFIKATNKVVAIVSVQPKVYRVAKKKKNTHEALITKHNLMIYRNTPHAIYIMTIWDTRKAFKKQ